jgi:hypothetical protein
MNNETPEADEKRDPKQWAMDACYVATQALARLHAWDWVRLGASSEAREAVAALERLRERVTKGDGPKEAEGLKWDALACRWVKKESTTGPAVKWNRTVGA